MRWDGRAAETAVMRGVLQPQDRAASRRELVARGPVRPGERALAPDLARGGMLLLIVLSNTGFHLWAASHGASGWHPVGGSALDRAVQLLMITVLDLRVYPAVRVPVRLRDDAAVPAPDRVRDLRAGGGGAAAPAQPVADRLRLRARRPC